MVSAAELLAVQIGWDVLHLISKPLIVLFLIGYYWVYLRPGRWSLWWHCYFAGQAMCFCCFRAELHHFSIGPGLFFNRPCALHIELPLLPVERHKPRTFRNAEGTLCPSDYFGRNRVSSGALSFPWRFKNSCNDLRFSTYTDGNQCCVSLRTHLVRQFLVCICRCSTFYDLRFTSGD